MIKVGFILSFIFVLSCGNAQYDGIYCADVDYYNPSTGTQSSYTLTAEVAKNTLVQINFPSGGHIDDEDFGTVKLRGNSAIASISGGKTYKVRLLKKGTDCFRDVIRAVRCAGYNKDGSRCKNSTDNKSGFCNVHLN